MAQNKSDVMNILCISTLQDVSLHLSNLPRNPLSYPLRWSQLTRLDLNCQPWHWHSQILEGGLNAIRALDVLCKCPNLLRCQLQINNGPFDTFIEVSPIILPQIHTLCFIGHPFENHFKNGSHIWSYPNFAVYKL
ncbi:hypothetical protein K438DRAFT_1800513 [Mycena galopus ATCC 62051]|nr:hypothetical protein K438DRAFT_1800513 [Mycena galopus ATCC 62051]